MKPVLVIEQEPRLAGQGVLGERLRAHQLPSLALRAWEDDLTALDPSDFGAVVSLGSNLSAAQEHEHRFLRDERRLLERALAVDVPVLGICLGCQLLARAAGAEAYPGETPEVGWCQIELTAAAKDDPLLGHLDGDTGVFQFHVDTFDLPPGATPLASSDLYPLQAFRLGSAWGVQFHPEVDFRQFDIWIGNHPGYCEPLGVDETALRASVRCGFEASGEASRLLLDGFLEVVRSRA